MNSNARSIYLEFVCVPRRSTARWRGASLFRDRWVLDTLDNTEFGIAEKRPPALRRWPRVAAHVPSARRPPHLEAELEQLSMNTRRAPKCVRAAHLANERAQLSRYLRSANTVAGSPAPKRPKPSTVPANDSLRPDDHKHIKDGRKPAIEPNKQKTIGIVEVRSLRRSPAKHIDLLPQDQVFRFQRCSRLEARSQDTEDQLEQIGHQGASLRRPPAASTPNRIFGTHSWWRRRMASRSERVFWSSQRSSLTMMCRHGLQAFLFFPTIRRKGAAPAV